MRRRLGAGAFALLAALALAAPATAQSWPAKPVKLVVPYAPGGTTDIVARLAGQRLGQLLGTTFVIENRGGAGATIGSELVAKAPPDGTTLLMCTVASHGISPGLYRKIGYDPVRDFSHIAMLGNAPTVMEVNPKFPARTFQEFVAHAKAHPGTVSFATSGAGSSNHIAGELIKQATGIDMVHVPYRGAGPALSDLLDNHVPAMFDTLTSSAAHLKAGNLRALATGGRARDPLLPDVPTFIELGFPDMLFISWFALCGPAKLPEEIVSRLNAAVAETLATPEVRARFAEASFSPDPMTPAQFADWVREETARWARIIKAVNATAD